MSRHNRERGRARRQPFKPRKPIVLVVTEGEVTEKEYLEALAAAAGNSRVEIVIDAGAGVPRSVVDRAKRLRLDAERRAKRRSDNFLAYDAVWCVIDVDDHPGLADARQSARVARIELAISNPSFELWLLLQFQEQPGFKHRDQIRELLKSHDRDYEKHVAFARYREGVSSAIERAKRLDRDAGDDGEPGRNPSTGMWRLALAIREDATV